MGDRGPMPKRSLERRRRNKMPGETTIYADGEVKIPATPKSLHAVARKWFDSLKESGQSAYFEPSDWAAALYVAEAMTKNLESTRFSGQLFSSVWAAMSDMLTTESARRRSRIEVERGLQELDEAPEVTAIDDYRSRLAT